MVEVLTFAILVIDYKFNRLHEIKYKLTPTKAGTRFVSTFIDLAALPLGNGDSGKLERAERDKES